MSMAETQANTLAVDNAVHRQTADSPTLTQSDVLVVADASHSHVTKTPTLIQAYEGFEPDIVVTQNALPEQQPAPPRRRTVTTPPGAKLLQIAEFVVTPKKYEEVFREIIEDLRVEYNEALSSKRHWKARYVRLRGYYEFWKAMGLEHVFRMVDRVVRMVFK